MKPLRDADDRLLASRVSDAVCFVKNSFLPKYIGFLDEHDVSVCRQVLRSLEYTRYAFFGGYEDADRVMLGVFDEYSDENELRGYPIEALTVSSRPQAKLSHRDYLGSLMSLGIKRDKIGDILCEDSRAVIFVGDSVAEYIATQLDRVGGEGVTVSRGFSEPLPTAHSFLQITAAVASMRLDCVVAALVKTSRGQASRLIEDGIVAVDGVFIDKVSVSVPSGCKISIRGKGKFVIDESSATTRKGRTVLKARKYI